jgi:hypothetical protein
MQCEQDRVERIAAAAQSGDIGHADGQLRPQYGYSPLESAVRSPAVERGGARTR